MMNRPLRTTITQCLQEKNHYLEISFALDHSKTLITIPDTYL